MHDRYLFLQIDSWQRVRIRLHGSFILEWPSFSDNESFIPAWETTVLCNKMRNIPVATGRALLRDGSAITRPSGPTVLREDV
jgi:hypothetical protein